MRGDLMQHLDGENAARFVERRCANGQVIHMTKTQINHRTVVRRRHQGVSCDGELAQLHCAAGAACT